MDALTDLYAHLTTRPTAPLPAGLRLALVEYLGSGKRAQRLALVELARHVAPQARTPWEAAGAVIDALQGHDRLGRIARGLRPPKDRTEALCAAVVRCGPAPTSRRTVWRALTVGCQTSRAELSGMAPNLEHDHEL